LLCLLTIKCFFKEKKALAFNCDRSSTLFMADSLPMGLNEADTIKPSSIMIY
jgi:hypothetical protein